MFPQARLQAPRNVRPRVAVRSALLSALVMGLGQLANGQFGKALVFFGLEVAFLGVFSDLFNMGFWGLVTLGTKPFRDHSILLLAEGLIALLVAAVGVAVYALNIFDAYRVGKLRDAGLRPPGFWETVRAVGDRGYPYLLVAPGFFLLLFVVVFPLLFMVSLAFTNYDLYHSPPAKLVDWVGLNNFVSLFRLDFWRQSFFSVLQWTVVWTLVSTTVQFALGLFLAVLLEQKGVRFKRVFRTVLILPWAVPSFISVLVFAGMFNDEFGPINRMLGALGLGSIPWLTDPFWCKVAILLIQFWLGFPFNLALCTGVLQSIPSDLYEAAEMDGATAWQKFWHITLPMVLYATAPLLIMQYAGNFNNFNVIYLFNQGGPPVPGQTAGGTDILISWVYKLTFETFKYNYAAAISLLIGLVIMGFALYQLRRTRSFREEGLMQG